MIKLETIHASVTYKNQLETTDLPPHDLEQTHNEFDGFNISLCVRYTPLQPLNLMQMT